MFRIPILAVAVLLAVTGCSQDIDTAAPAAPAGVDTFSTYVDTAGNISRPADFRKNWVHLGSWFVKQDEEAAGAGVHDVYATRESVNAFKQHGQWQDGAVIVKTVSGIREQRLTTGNAQWAGETGVWFVMVRDRKNRFQANKAWGEGWGWALFKSDDPDKNLTTNWKGEGFNNCFGCHAPAQDTEWVYIDGYPTIRDAARYPRLSSAADSLTDPETGAGTMMQAQ